MLSISSALCMIGTSTSRNTSASTSHFARYRIYFERTFTQQQVIYHLTDNSRNLTFIISIYFSGNPQQFWDGSRFRIPVIAKKCSCSADDNRRFFIAYSSCSLSLTVEGLQSWSSESLCDSSMITALRAQFYKLECLCAQLCSAMY